MKKIISILSIAGLLITSSGCTDWLDLRPESEIVLDDYWQNESQVTQVLSACYRSVTERDVMSRMLVWGELRSDNVWYGSGMPSDMSKMLNVDITADNGYCHWGSFYTVINYCNNFLHYAPGVVDKDANFTESKLHSMEAEVLTLRALMYFYLVRTFENVPWVNEPSIDDAQDYRIPQSPEDEILNYIVSDLQTALRYSRDNFETLERTKGRVTTNAIRALLADIYLWQEEYSKCIEMCDQILNDPESDLELEMGEDVISKVFYQGNSKESIFELQFDDDQMFNSVVYDYFGGSGRMAGQWSFPAPLVTGRYSPFNYVVGSGKESSEDLREKDFLRQVIGGDSYYVFKYAGADRREDPTTEASTYFYRNVTANWIVYRLSEIYLMKAEAMIQLESNKEQAIELINTIYMRSNVEEDELGLIADNYSTKLKLDELYMRERQRELMFEGKRWFDLMRMARRVDSPAPLLSYVTKKFTGGSSGEANKMSVMEALYLPVHTDELKANSALVQNEFYKVQAEENK
ncbi:RagB/SusD family nutrient uptake outer membrane protein [Maribellus sediminis]|uniref:RagB/SusD family nutrient uptake outer membrane protein n=1 Tax=Maribellus sediminis TaxID=2696285 RepID=UPI001431AE8A|nr:RagB/SusD family nutrient uptake outer membrane protein [Maribellus sediminis]